jgi:hypothetical protein
MAKPLRASRVFSLLPFRKILLLVFLVLVAYLLYVFVIMQPSNDGNWMIDYSRLPIVTYSGHDIHLDDVRDFSYSPTEILMHNWQNRVIDPSKLKQIWFVYEPFSSFKPIAHTFFVFDFSDQAPIAISAEPRRQVGQDFTDMDLLYSSVNRYNLVYQWGTETDLTVSRALYWKQKIYMLPLTIPQEDAQKILLQMLENTQMLQEHPQYYNLLLRSCNNELAHVANETHPGAIPPSFAIYLPGYAAELLYKLGYIPHDKPLDDVLSHYMITDFVTAHYKDQDFSNELRDFLARKD